MNLNLSVISIFDSMDMLDDLAIEQLMLDAKEGELKE